MKHEKRQPAGGKFQGYFETVSFANKRKKNIKRREIAKASKRKNRNK